MELTDFENKRGYFFDGYNLLIGYIGGDGSIYFKYLSGKVIYSKPLYFSRTWMHGYKYNNWDFNDFEFIPYNVFKDLKSYLSFIETANFNEIKMFFKLKDLMKTKDFINCNIKM
jgi:hypothetical protein